MIKVGDKAISYATNNPLVPISYDGKSFTFEGRRLMKILNGNKTITYDYNDQGLRTSKTITGDGIFPSSRYFYDGTKLITDYSSDRRLDFLYDENDRLYGFVLNEVDTYFYVRDTLENILGIIDNTGKLVVKYTYNAWGKILSITGSKATTIGMYNPFRYKGYYYDDETDMYYCHTRYYVPEWCRWLCADHTDCLKAESLNAMNLFAYCANNPVMYIDPNGAMAKWARWLILGLATVASIAISVVTAGAAVGTVAMVFHLAATGFLIGVGTNLIKQTIAGNDLNEMDPSQTLRAGAIGAVSTVVAYPFTHMFAGFGEVVGAQLGYGISQTVIYGRQIASIFGGLTKIGGKIGETIGFITGSAIANELSYNMFGEFPGIKEDSKVGVFDWIKDMIKRLKVLTQSL